MTTSIEPHSCAEAQATLDRVRAVANEQWGWNKASALQRALHDALTNPDSEWGRRCEPDEGECLAIHSTNPCTVCEMPAEPDAGEVEALAKVLTASARHIADAYDVARAVLVSDWLAARDARARREGGEDAHRCGGCTDCIHNGNKCCGCYDGACCKTGPFATGEPDAAEVEALTAEERLRVHLRRTTGGLGIADLDVVLAARDARVRREGEADAWGEGYRAAMNASIGLQGRSNVGAAFPADAFDRNPYRQGDAR